MPEDEDRESAELTEQEQGELAELEVGDQIRAEAEAEEEEEGDWQEPEEPTAEEEEEAAEPESEPGPSASRSAGVSVPVAPVLGRTGDVLWGKDKPKPRRRSDLDDLLEVPHANDNDLYIGDLLESPDDDELGYDEEDDLSDLFQVTEEDIMGRKPKPRPKKALYRRTGRRYPPPTSMGGAGGGQ